MAFPGMVRDARYRPPSAEQQALIDQMRANPGAGMPNGGNLSPGMLPTKGQNPYLAQQPGGGAMTNFGPGVGGAQSMDALYRPGGGFGSMNNGVVGPSRPSVMPGAPTDPAVGVNPVPMQQPGAPAPAPGQASGFGKDEFMGWLQQTYGQGATASPEQLQGLMNQLGTPTGPGGMFSADQFEKAKTLAQQSGQWTAQGGGQPGGEGSFFSEFDPGAGYQAPNPYVAPQMTAGPRYQADRLQPGAEYTAPTPYSAGQWQAPTPYAAGQWQAPQPFQHGSYAGPGEFRAPTMEEATNDPGYQASLKEGQKALEQSAAARGTLFTGGTLKDIINYGQERGAQQYDKVYNRRSGEFDRSAAHGAQTFATNYGVARDMYGMNTDVSGQAFDRNTSATRNQYLDTAAVGGAAFDRNLGATRNQYLDTASVGGAAYDRNQTTRFGTFDRNSAAGRNEFLDNASVDANVFRTNADLGMAAFDRNRQGGLDAYDRGYQGRRDAFEAKRRGEEMSFEDMYRRWRDSLDTNTRLATMPIQ